MGNIKFIKLMTSGFHTEKKKTDGDEKHFLLDGSLSFFIVFVNFTKLP